AGATVEFNEPFKGLDAARHAVGQLALQAADDFVLASVNHGHADLADDGHCAIGLARFEKPFDDFLCGAKIFAVGRQYTERESGSLVPIGVLEVEIREQLGLFATLVQVGDVFEKLGSVREITLGGGGSGLHDGGSEAIRVNLERLVRK